MTALDQTFRAIKALPGNNKRNDPDNKWGQQGLYEFSCDKCGKPVHWARVSSNGHMRAWCETNNCFYVMS